MAHQPLAEIFNSFIVPVRHTIHPTFRQTFLHGIIAGIGWAFGATIVFAILIAIFGYVISVLGHVPGLNYLIAPINRIVEDTQDPRVEVLEKDQGVVTTFPTGDQNQIDNPRR